MKTFLFRVYIFIFCFPFVVSFAQPELVPNNSFETYTTCPVGFSEFDGKVSDWYNPNTASPDYMNACANPFPAGVPKNGTGFQVPQDGVAYAGTYTFGGTIYREFIQIQLASPLVAGSTYLFSMYVVLHNKSNTAIDDLGAYFSVTAPTAAGTGMLAGAPVPQISNPFGSVITDTLNWTLVSGTYTATGGEEYLTLGHLKSDATTTYQSLPYGSQGAYYYFDNVSLKLNEILPITLTSFEGNLLEENGSRIVQLTWNTATEINNCCYYIERSTDGINFSDIGKVEGNGTTTLPKSYSFYDRLPQPGMNYYRLRQVDYNGTSYLSQIISLEFANGDKPINIYFNGNNWSVINLSGFEAEMQVMNIAGSVVVSEIINTGTTEVDFSGISAGLLMITFRNKESGQLLSSSKIFNTH